jgi:hypothetical protein
LVAALAAVVVIVIAVAGIAVTTSSDRRTGGTPSATSSASVDGSDAPLFPTHPDHQGPPLLLAPTLIPDGFHVVVSTLRGTTGASGSPRGTVQYWVKLDAGAQRPLASFQVAWGPADLGEAAKQSGVPGSVGQRGGDALDSFRSQSVPATVAGHDGLYSEGLATFAWEQGNEFVTVSGAIDGPTGAWPEHLARDQLADIAAHLVRGPDGRYTLTEPPAGFRLSAEEPSYASEGTDARELVYTDGATHGFAIELVDDTQWPPGVTLVNPPARLIAIRDEHAVVTPYANAGLACGPADAFLCGDLPHRSVIWTEPDNTTVTVTSIGITETQLLALARSLEPVPPDDWPQVTDPTSSP